MMVDGWIMSPGGFRWKPTEPVPGGHPKAKIVRCPECGSVGRDDDGKTFTVATREGDTVHPMFGKAHVIDVGWRCLKCNHEFGFEVL